MCLDLFYIIICIIFIVKFVTLNSHTYHAICNNNIIVLASALVFVSISISYKLCCCSKINYAVKSQLRWQKLFYKQMDFISNQAIILFFHLFSCSWPQNSMVFLVASLKYFVVNNMATEKMKILKRPTSPERLKKREKKRRK